MRSGQCSPERGGSSLHIPEITRADALKIGAIEQAQRAGNVSRLVPAPLLLELIMASAQVTASCAVGMEDEHAKRRQAIKDAVQRLIEV